MRGELSTRDQEISHYLYRRPEKQPATRGPLDIKTDESGLKEFFPFPGVPRGVIENSFVIVDPKIRFQGPAYHMAPASVLFAENGIDTPLLLPASQVETNTSLYSSFYSGLHATTLTRPYAVWCGKTIPNYETKPHIAIDSQELFKKIVEVSQCYQYILDSVENDPSYEPSEQQLQIIKDFWENILNLGGFWLEYYRDGLVDKILGKEQKTALNEIYSKATPPIGQEIAEIFPLDELQETMSMELYNTTPQPPSMNIIFQVDTPDRPQIILGDHLLPRRMSDYPDLPWRPPSEILAYPQGVSPEQITIAYFPTLEQVTPLGISEETYQHYILRAQSLGIQVQLSLTALEEQGVIPRQSSGCNNGSCLQRYYTSTGDKKFTVAALERLIEEGKVVRLPQYLQEQQNK